MWLGTGLRNAEVIGLTWDCVRMDEGELLFKWILPSKFKALSRWKSLDVQRIHQDPKDLRRLASYLAKQVDLDYVALDGFNSDFSKEVV